MKTHLTLLVILIGFFSFQLHSQEESPSEEVWNVLENKTKDGTIPKFDSIKEIYVKNLLPSTWESIQTFSDSNEFNLAKLDILKVINDERVKQLVPEIKPTRQKVGSFLFNKEKIRVFEEAVPEKVILEFGNGRIKKINVYFKNSEEPYFATNISLCIDTIEIIKLHPKNNSQRFIKLTDLFEITDEENNYLNCNNAGPEKIINDPNRINSNDPNYSSDSSECKLIRDTTFILTKKNSEFIQGSFKIKLKKHKRKFLFIAKDIKPVLIEDELTIEKVEINLDEGTVWRLLVHNSNNNEYFTNNRGSVPLWDFYKRRQKKLISSFNPKINPNKKWTTNKMNKPNKNPKRYIYLGDAISYIPSSGRFSFPKDTSIIIDKTNKQVTLFNRDNLYSFLSIRTFTDILALTDNADNGLVQIEGEGRFFLNQIPCRNTKFYFGNYVEPFMRFTKFGYEEDYVLHSDDITPPDIFIKSKLAFAVDINIANWLLEYGGFNLDFGLRLDHSTLKTDPESSSKGSADLFTPYFKVGATVIESRNYGLEGSFSHYWQNIMGNYGRGLDEDITNPVEFQTKYWVPEILFYVGNKSALGTLFLKIVHYYAYQDPSGSFTQFHFGYNIRLKLPANKYGK